MGRKRKKTAAERGGSGVTPKQVLFWAVTGTALASAFAWPLGQWLTRIIIGS